MTQQKKNRGGITIRDPRINDLIECSSKLNKGGLPTPKTPTDVLCTLKYNNKIRFRTNAFDGKIYNPLYNPPTPQAWAIGEYDGKGLIGITTDNKYAIKSLGTPYFAKDVKLEIIAKDLKKDGFKVDFD